MPHFNHISASLTRYAPTPSGFLHLGNLFSFSVTRALAGLFKCEVMLRIDDMDTIRVKEDYLHDIFSTLERFHFPLNAGPHNVSELHKKFSQQFRLPLYNNALEKLRTAGLIYGCDCTRSGARDLIAPNGCYGSCSSRHLDLSSQNVSWRLRTRRGALLRVNTLFGTQSATITEDMYDFVVRRKDGKPAYQLCSVVDDVFFGVDLVVRGEDLYNSTLAQLELAAALDLQPFLNSTFVHHGLLVDKGGTKLSKSAGARASAQQLPPGADYSDLLLYLCKKAKLTPSVNDDEFLSDLLQAGMLR